MAVVKKSYYEVLKISPDANSDELRQAYKELSLKWHPDKNPDKPEEATKMMQEIGQAYSVLKDDAKRNNYDRKLNGTTELDNSDIMDDFEARMEEALLEAWFRSMFSELFCPYAGGGGQYFRRSSYRYGSGSSRGYTGCGYTKDQLRDQLRKANYERAKAQTDPRSPDESRKSVEPEAEKRQQKAMIRRAKKRRQKIGKKIKNPQHESVYKMVCECERQEGVSREEVWLCVSSKMSKRDFDDALNFLSKEGYIQIHLTTDKDDFKTTDS